MVDLKFLHFQDLCGPQVATSDWSFGSLHLSPHYVSPHKTNMQNLAWSAKTHQIKDAEVQTDPSEAFAIINSMSYFSSIFLAFI